MRHSSGILIVAGALLLGASFAFSATVGDTTTATPPAASADAVPIVPLFLDPALRDAAAADPPQAMRFLTSDDFPPFNFTDGSGRLTGYNVELARAICRELDIPCTIQARPFYSLVQSLADNAGDVIAAGLRDTPDLRRYLIYSNAYLRIPARFVMPRDGARAPTPDGLAGRPVGVVENTPHAAFLAAFYPEAMVATYATTDALVSALAAREVDAAFADALSLSFWLSGPGAACCTFVGGPFVEPGYFGEGLKIAVARDDLALVQLLDVTLARLEAKGVLADLYVKYFPVGLY